MSDEEVVLYTNETSVFASGLKNVSLEEPITVVKDPLGHIAVVDGNHHAYQAWCEGKTPLQEQIGTIGFDVSKNSDFRPVSELKVIDK